MSFTVIVRAGTKADYGAAMLVWRRAAVAAAEPFSEHYGERIRSHLEKPDSFLLLTESGKEIVGMVIGMQGREAQGSGPPIPGLCHVSAVFVVPEWWGYGVGKSLVDAVVEDAQERSYERAQLWTHVSNARARRLYEGRGFVASGLREDEGKDEILHYERPL